MRIGIDLHGTITDDPYYYQKFISSLSSHHDIYIISGPPIGQIQKELKELNFNSDKISDFFSVVDFLRFERRPMNQDENGYWWAINDLDWWTSKAHICNTQRIDILIDNEPRYGDHLKTYSPRTLFLLHNPGINTVSFTTDL